MNLYVIAMACVVHGSCSHGYFLIDNAALVNCETDVMPMIEGHQSRDKAGNIVIWHAQNCQTRNSPPPGQMLGMF
jgi:hypothetical protein